MQTISKQKTFDIGSIGVYVWGSGMTVIEFHKVVRRTDKSVWLKRLYEGGRTNEGSLNSERILIDPGSDLSSFLKQKRVKTDSNGDEYIEMEGGHMELWDGGPVTIHYRD